MVAIEIFLMRLVAVGLFIYLTYLINPGCADFWLTLTTE